MLLGAEWRLFYFSNFHTSFFNSKNIIIVHIEPRTYYWHRSFYFHYFLFLSLIAFMSKIEPNRQTTKSPNTISTGVHRIRTHSSEVLLYGHNSLLFRLLRCYCWRVARYTNLNNTNSIALWVQVLGKSMLIVVYVRSCEASNSSSLAVYS